MTIAFNNIPTTIRTPGAYVEIDNSRALQGLAQNPHKVLILGQKVTGGSKDDLTLQSITRDGLADQFFGPGSVAARMCNTFKDNNPNTELWAMTLSDAGAGAAASGAIHFSAAISATGYSQSGAATYYLMINGTKTYVALTSGWSVVDLASATKTVINANSELPVIAATAGGSAVSIVAVNANSIGNDIDIRANYYVGQSSPIGWGDSAIITAMAGGANNPDLADVWAIIENEQFQYMLNPYDDASNLTEIEEELADRFGPLIDLQGHAFTAIRATAAGATTAGNARNSPHESIMAAYDSPTGTCEWTAALGAIASFYLNIDPARPLQYLKLKGILPPPSENRYTRSERDVVLTDGIATWITDSSGNVLIERCITTYQTNAAGLADASYLDVTTLATLGEIRFQFKARMLNAFITQRFKLADDTFPVQPGTKVATPSTVKLEIVSLFTELRNAGLVENLDDFVDNLIVERNATDVNRVDVLLPPDLINQFRILAAQIQFLL